MCIINTPSLLQFKLLTLILRFATSENPADSQPYKSYTNPLATIAI